MGLWWSEAGQVVVETALALPALVVTILMLVQIGIVVYDSVLTAHVAREAVRVASVDPSPGAARSAAERAAPLQRSRLSVAIAGRGAAGSRVEVTVTYRAPTEVPLVGALVGDVVLHARATMRVE